MDSNRNSRRSDGHIEWDEVFRIRRKSAGKARAKAAAKWKG